MQCYGQVKGRAYRKTQPEPELECYSCHNKFEQHVFWTSEGWTKFCPGCLAAIREEEEREAQHLERLAAEGFKRCNSCFHFKPLSEFKGHNGTNTKLCRKCRARKRGLDVSEDML